MTVHAHPDAILPKYHRTETGARDIGMPASARSALDTPVCRFMAARQPVEIAPGVWTTGEIPRRHPEEAASGSFCRDAEGRDPDLLMDDQALFIRTKQGTIVVLGCAHAGVINTLDYIQRLTDGDPMLAVVGGTHLGSAADERLHWTLEQLRRFVIGMLAPMHCTGQKAAAALWSAFPGTCRPCGAGTTFEF